jgi:hypothetical protein
MLALGTWGFGGPVALVGYLFATLSRTDGLPAGLALVTVALLWRLRKLSEPLIVFAALLGLLVFLLMTHV